MLYAEPGHAVSVRFGGRPQRGRDARQRGAGRAAVGPSERAQEWETDREAMAPCCACEVRDTYVYFDTAMELL